MKLRTLATACALIAGLAASSTAFGGQMSKTFDADRLIQKVSCDTHDEDKQAYCMRDCDDTWIKATQAYHADIPQAGVEKKACEAKCGCK